MALLRGSHACMAGVTRQICNARAQHMRAPTGCRCKFTSHPFQDAAVTSVEAMLANPNPPPSDPEPSFEW